MWIIIIYVIAVISEINTFHDSSKIKCLWKKNDLLRISSF